jgi:hypothetical protein
MQRNGKSVENCVVIVCSVLFFFVVFIKLILYDFIYLFIYLFVPLSDPFLPSFPENPSTVDTQLKLKKGTNLI